MTNEENSSQSIKKAHLYAESARSSGSSDSISTDQIQVQMQALVDRVMGEAALYAPEHAAISIKQNAGDIVEAVETLRAYRQTISRKYQSEIIDTEGMEVRRRISSAFREIPGGQILGGTCDYTQRLLDEKLARETQESADAYASEFDKTVPELAEKEKFPRRYTRVVDILKEQGLMAPVNENENREVVDTITEPLEFPAPRSAALQTLAKSDTGGLMAFAYSAMRGQGGDHPTIGELRVGYAGITITDSRNRKRSIGRIKVTESANISKIKTRKKDPVPYMSLGYGLCFGQNETKAICMGIVDRSNRIPGDGAPAISQEFSLYHLDGPESKGFTSSLKIPNYTETVSELQDLRAAIKRNELAKQEKEKQKNSEQETEKDLV